MGIAPLESRAANHQAMVSGRSHGGSFPSQEETRLSIVNGPTNVRPQRAAIHGRLPRKKVFVRHLSDKCQAGFCLEYSAAMAITAGASAR